MRVRLLQLDAGKLPNLALMRIAAHHKALGDEVSFAFVGTVPGAEAEPGGDRIYASLIFQKTLPVAMALKARFPDAILGGTGWDVTGKLSDHGITTQECDYSIYPSYQFSVGFSQRGCRLRCGFCVVPAKEGRVAEDQSIHQIWRGEPYPKKIVLLDNDFFGQPNWRTRIDEIRAGGFKVSFSQGINSRLIDDEAAEAIASVPYYDTDFKARRIYTAWDSRKDEERLFKGLNALVHYGVKPDHIMVYMLIGYWPGETDEDRLYRQRKLREFGCRPYPMPFVRNSHLIGFQRWCIGAYDKRIPWEDFVAARYQPRNLDKVRAAKKAGSQ